MSENDSGRLERIAKKFVTPTYQIILLAALVFGSIYAFFFSPYVARINHNTNRTENLELTNQNLWRKIGELERKVNTLERSSQSRPTEHGVLVGVMLKYMWQLECVSGQFECFDRDALEWDKELPLLRLELARLACEASGRIYDLHSPNCNPAPRTADEDHEVGATKESSSP